MSDDGFDTYPWTSRMKPEDIMDYVKLVNIKLQFVHVTNLVRHTK